MKTWNAFASALVIFALASPAMADFSGDYDVANWTSSTTTTLFGSASVNTSGAPVHVELNAGADSDVGFESQSASGVADFTIAAPVGGTVSGDFEYSESAFFNTPGNANAGTLLNGVYTQFATNNGDTGSFSFNVNAGDTFGFRMQAGSNPGQEISGSVKVTNFSGPVPEPASMLLWGTAAGATALVGWRRRRRKA